MATTLVEARAQATTLPRRAAVDPTAGAAERESAKFMVQKKRDVKERERKTTGRNQVVVMNHERRKGGEKSKS
jgi:hypothetical protein